MEDLVHLLQHLLSRGAIKIEIRISQDESLIPGEIPRRGNYKADCTLCSFQGWYSSPQSAKKALRAKEQHCTRTECPKHHRATALQYQWIEEMHEGENNE